MKLIKEQTLHEPGKLITDVKNLILKSLSDSMDKLKKIVDFRIERSTPESKPQLDVFL